MRLVFFVVILFSSCTPSIDCTDDISQLLYSIENDIFKCSKYIHPKIRVQKNDSTYVYTSEEINFIKERYIAIDVNKNGRINISINITRGLVEVVVTCDYPRLKMLTNENNTYMFILKRKGLKWILIREINMN